MPWKMTRPKTPTNEAKPRRRPTADYGVHHQRTRAYLLKTRPLCEVKAEGCTGFSQEAHHLVYPATGPDDYLAVCRACHHTLENEKTSPARMGDQDQER